MWINKKYEVQQKIQKNNKISKRKNDLIVNNKHRRKVVKKKNFKKENEY